MKTFDPKKVKYRDNLTSQRRSRFIAKGSLLSIGLVIIALLLGYALFYTSWFTIDRVAIDNLGSDHASAVNAVIEEQLHRNFLGVPIGKNILIFPSDNVSDKLKEKFTFLENLSIKKNYFHAIAINGTERKPEGVWCLGEQCHYYDHEGILWGDAIKSSGVLLMNVSDLRDHDADRVKIDSSFFTAIQTVINNFRQDNIKIKEIVIPRGTFTEFDVYIAGGYMIRFSLDSQLVAQLDALKIFKAKKIDTAEIHPQVLDFRFDGRVYYK